MRTGVSGTVIAVQGNVLDVAFAQDLPPLHRALLAQGPRPVVLEVASHLDAQTVRCIAHADRMSGQSTSEGRFA
jgi:F0F1-type ATP synthase beta subunit